MINILKQELIKMKELQEWKKIFLFLVLQEFELSVRKNRVREAKVRVNRCSNQPKIL